MIHIYDVTLIDDQGCINFQLLHLGKITRNCESGKWRAQRAHVPYVPHVPTCPRALQVLHALCALRAHARYVPYVPTCLYILETGKLKILVLVKSNEGSKNIG